MPRFRLRMRVGIRDADAAAAETPHASEDGSMAPNAVHASAPATGALVVGRYLEIPLIGWLVSVLGRRTEVELARHAPFGWALIHVRKKESLSALRATNVDHRQPRYKTPTPTHAPGDEEQREEDTAHEPIGFVLESEDRWAKNDKRRGHPEKAPPIAAAEARIPPGGFGPGFGGEFAHHALRRPTELTGRIAEPLARS